MWIVFGSEMANEEVTIQFEGYEDDTATYVVVTNISGEIDEDGPLVETEQIDIQPVYEEDLIIETIDPICNDTNIELVTSSSGKLLLGRQAFYFFTVYKMRF